MVGKGETPVRSLLLPFLLERGKLRRKLKNNTNLIVINEECQFCESTAMPVACSKCYALVCADCIGNFNGRPVCGLCRDELEHPRRLAKVLMFSVGATSRHVERPD